MFYSFTITIGCSADTPEQAWEEAVTALAIEPGDMPEYNEEIEDDDDR